MDLKKNLAGIVIALSISSTALCSDSENPNKFLKYASVASYLAACSYVFYKKNESLYKKDQ